MCSLPTFDIICYRIEMTVRNISATRIQRFLIPRIADMFFAILFCFLTINFGQRLLNDGDTGFHIRTGEYIIKTFTIPRQDLFSFIEPPLSWTAHEWLSEVIMAAVHNLSGLTGIVVFFAGLIALVHYLLLRMLRRINGHVLIPLILVMLAAASSMLHWLARPHIFSLLMMVVWYDWLDRYQHDDSGPLYFLPLLMLLWVNLHGGFIAGFILLGLYGAGNLILSRFGEKTLREAAKRKWRFILKITVLCMAAALCNPFGYDIFFFPFRLVFDSYIMDHIVEWASPDFHDMGVFPFRVFLLSILALLAISRRRPNIIELGLLLFFLDMALCSERYIALFAIIASPIAARLADGYTEKLGGRTIAWLRCQDVKIAAIDGRARGFLWPIATALMVSFLLAQSGNVITFDKKIKPVAAVEFLKRERIPGNMFNNDEFGDYVIYAAWPQYRVFIDGRLDMYGAYRIKEYFKIKNIDRDWESVMRKYDMNWVIFDADSPLSRHLQRCNGWRLIYDDKVANIFVRNIPLYQPLINKYPIPRSTLRE